MKRMLIVLAAWLAGARMGIAGIAITSFHGNGELVWTGSQTAAYSVE